LTAAQLINTAPEADLANLLFQYGEEPRARKIAKMIVQARPLTTTLQLAEIVRKAYPGHSRVHPATRTFQAIRIAVNDELSVLEQALPRAMQSFVRREAGSDFLPFIGRSNRQRFFRHESKDWINPPYEKIYAVERKATLKEMTRKPSRPKQMRLN